MTVGIKAAYDCVKAFSETDLTEDLKKIDVPTLIAHGDDDQIVPIGRCRPQVVEDRQKLDPEGLPGRAARPHRRPRTGIQQRSACLSAVLSSGTPLTA